MVNTFLTDADFKTSAKNLDTKRLGCQRKESYQILCLGEDLTYLGTMFGDPLPANPLQRRAWIRRIAAKYRTLPYRFVIRDLHSAGKIERLRIQVDLQIVDKFPKKKDFKHPLTIDGVTLYPTDRIVKLGYCYHPAVVMWLGYPEALKEYINVHIQEWIQRNNKNTMKTYTVPDKIEYPPWTQDPSFHQNHKSALLYKEQNNKEPLWYVLKHDFVAAGKFVDYIWPY